MRNNRQDGQVLVAKRPWQRLRGLLFSRPQGQVLLLPGCRDVHTFGMGYPIDVAFIDGRGQVVASYRNLPPRCRIRAPVAVAALERPAQRISDWYQPGAYIDSDVLYALHEKGF